MFDFERLDLYSVMRNQNMKVLLLLNSHATLDVYIREQWRRASVGSVLNLAEGVGRIVEEEKRQFITLARGNIFECTALLQMAYDLKFVEMEKYEELYANYEQISKMLLGMYRSKSQ